MRACAVGGESLTPSLHVRIMACATHVHYFIFNDHTLQVINGHVILSGTGPHRCDRPHLPAPAPRSHAPATRGICRARRMPPVRVLRLALVQLCLASSACVLRITFLHHLGQFWLNLFRSCAERSLVRQGPV